MRRREQASNAVAATCGADGFWALAQHPTARPSLTTALHAPDYHIVKILSLKKQKRAALETRLFWKRTDSVPVMHRACPGCRGCSSRAHAGRPRRAPADRAVPRLRWGSRPASVAASHVLGALAELWRRLRGVAVGFESTPPPAGGSWGSLRAPRPVLVEGPSGFFCIKVTGLFAEMSKSLGVYVQTPPEQPVCPAKPPPDTSPGTCRVRNPERPSAQGSVFT